MSAMLRIKNGVVEYSFKLVLNCVHLVFTISLLIGEIWSSIRRRLTFDSNMVKFSQSVGKIPNHLVFIIDGNEQDRYVSLNDISQLIQWCVTLGIVNISLYDNKGKYNYQILEH